MERDNPLDDLSDERLLELFRGVDGPSPSPDFALRTMRAVMRDPVPAGRKALRDPLTSMFGWAAVIAFSSNCSPEAASLPWKVGPYHEAVPTSS